MANQEEVLRFSLQSIYLYFGLFAFLVIAIADFFSSYQRIKPQLGFIYLATVVVKVLIFSVAYRNAIFSIEKLALIERLSLLIPALFFLFFEVIFMAKILNRKQR
ncbi:hypothetical protein GCM10009117_19340 [Gangjinia marincola]|uniref:Uncharacterized protein n=1 Tax=Gangjinia marincola TaxID=578463 RepID=A0ABN1MHW3_9FLAO